MYINHRALFPKLSNTYSGPWFMYGLLIFLTIINTARSFIHILATDGGAESIAGIPINGDGGTNIIAIFGQWGATQLLLAMICWVIIFRYRALTPFAFLVLFIEQALRYIAGSIHPIVSTHTPPGAIITQILLPLLTVAVVLSLVQRKDIKK